MKPKGCFILLKWMVNEHFSCQRKGPDEMKPKGRFISAFSLSFTHSNSLMTSLNYNLDVLFKEYLNLLAYALRDL